MYGHDTEADIKPLNPERAVQAAADLVGEGIIFAVRGQVFFQEIIVLYRGSNS